MARVRRTAASGLVRRAGAPPVYRPTGWVYLREANCTLRWQRGDEVAYVLRGNQFDAYPDHPLRAEVLATIPVSPHGWRDLTELRHAGQRWLRSRVA